MPLHRHARNDTFTPGAQVAPPRLSLPPLEPPPLEQMTDPEDIRAEWDRLRTRPEPEEPHKVSRHWLRKVVLYGFITLALYGGLGLVAFLATSGK